MIFSKIFKECYRTHGKVDKEDCPYYVAEVKPKFSIFWKYIFLGKNSNSIGLSYRSYSSCPTEEEARKLLLMYKNRRKAIQYYNELN